MLRTTFALALALFALPAIAQTTGIQIALQADTGKYLTRCYGCVPGADNTATNTATIHGEANRQGQIAPESRFTLIPQAGGKVALRSDSGMFMARCSGCTTVNAGGVNEVARMHVRDPSEGAWATFTPRRMPNGKYVFQSDNGNYLARCRGCIQGSLQPDVAMMHETNPNAAWAQWNVIWLP